MSETLNILNKKWKDTCRVLFKEEIGGMEEYEKWLSELNEPVSSHKSSISGKEVISAPTDYCSGAKWMSLDEVDYSKKFEPLSINEIKDIDSVSQALQERIYYSGNIFFGNSGHIEKSSNINDSFYIYNVGRLGNSKYVAYSTIARHNDSCFGCNTVGESGMCIRCSRNIRINRCFELWMSQNSADCYYSTGLDGCSNCLFSFNVRNKRHAIGNLELPPAKYESVKSKIVSEVVEELKKKKRAPSLLEIAQKAGSSKKPEFGMPEIKEEAKDKSKIENAFLQTTGILFGKKLEGGIDAYEKWLTRHTRKVITRKSAASGKDMLVANCANYPNLPKDRILAQEEAYAYGEQAKISEADLGDLSLANAHKKISSLAFFNGQMEEGNNPNLIDCVIDVDSSNCYRGSINNYSKYCGYCFWPRNSQYLFGCDSPFDSAFSIHVYSCTQLTRCFELDCCGYCSDSYFCHNGENLTDCMFCFNTKNRKNCIGNAQYSPDEYKKVKTSLVSQIAQELERKKDFKLDIYNVGCQK